MPAAFEPRVGNVFALVAVVCCPVTTTDCVLDELVAYVVVAFGGFLRTSGKLFAMPFKLFKYDGKKAEYILDLSKEQLEAAPGFDPEHWPSMADEQWHRDVHSYYGYEPWWESLEGVL